MELVEKTVSEYGYYLNEMMEVIEDKPIQEVTHSDGRRYVDTLSQLPVNRDKNQKYREKTILEILKMKGVKPQNPQNVNKKLGRISTFWKWVGEKYPDYVKEQVFKGKKLTTTKSIKRKEERFPFTNNEVKEIFNPHNYLFYTVQMSTGGEVMNYHYHSVRTHHLPYYWVPLIGVFSGMRLDEICQLRIQDVYKEGKHWVMNIRESEDTKIKTQSSERIIPVHSQLIKLGFHE